MRRTLIIFCCTAVLLTGGCSKITEVPSAERTVETESEIVKTEINTTPIENTVEETKSVESAATTAEEKEVVNELTTPTESEHTIPQKTETTVTETKSSAETDSSVAETKMPTETTSPTVGTDITEIESVEETNCNQPYVDTAEIEKLVVEYINEYRVAQGDTAAITLPSLTEVARYRAKQLVTNFSHNSIPNACNMLQYGEFIDMTLYGGTAEESYYRGYNREAIGKGSWFGTAEQMAHRIANGFYKSKNHWRYVGSSEYTYIAVGVEHENNYWYVCMCMSHTDYGG